MTAPILWSLLAPRPEVEPFLQFRSGRIRRKPADSVS